jgi:hypothetical protein
LSSENFNNLSNEQLDAAIANVESAIGGSNDKPADKPTLFEKSRERELDTKLGEIHDRSEAREDAVIASKEVPSTRVDSFDDAFAKTYDFLNASPAEKATLQSASKLVEQVRENAKRFGVELSDTEAFKAAMDLENSQRAEQAAGYAPVVDHMKSVFPDQNPVETSRWFADIKRSADQDLPGTIAWMAQQYNVHPMQLAQEIARRYGNQPMQAQQYQAQQYQGPSDAAVQSMIDGVAPTLPNFNRLEEDIIELLESGKVKRTGDPERDLKAAWKEAMRRDTKLTADEKLDKSLRRTYDRANSRKV